MTRRWLTAIAFLVFLSPAVSRAADFTPPDESTIPNDVFGESVKRGKAIFNDPQTGAHDFAGNVLHCSNCHLDSGRQANASPMWGAWPLYPQFRAKNGKINSMVLRIQECFRYSMNGKMPPDDSQVLTDLQSYFFWLAKGTPTGVKMPGQGFPELPRPDKAPDLVRGEAEFTKNCASCHGADGNGNDSAGIPPVWGMRSFNKGAGMFQLDTAARFIRANMPLGMGGSLSVQQAYDIAAYVESKPRPADPRVTAAAKP
jgi:thiosulfate dehydrogenase